MSDYKRAIKLRPRKIYDKNGQEKDLKIVEAELYNVMRILKTEAETQLEEHGVEYKWLLNSDTQPNGEKWASQPNIVGTQLGLELITQAAKDLRSTSMVKYMVSAILVPTINSWITRERIESATIDKWVSNGARRTVTSGKPTFGYVLPLTAVNNNYATMTIEDGVIKLNLIVKDERLTIEFNLPQKYQYGKYSKPNIVFKNGRLEYCFARSLKRPLPMVSNRFVIGVDVGIHALVSWSVVDTVTRKPIQSGELPIDLKRLEAGCKRSQLQVTSLRKKLESDSVLSNPGLYLKTFEELRLQRKALSRKREELARRSGLFLSQLSAEHDNAVIIMEDLSHIKNTMLHGRWVRGRLSHWVRAKQEEAGGLVFTVNAAYTSQDCSECGARSHKFIDRLFVCKSCGVVIDRDINASVNIARRGFASVKKSVVTRGKKSDSSKRVVRPARRKRECFVSKKLLTGKNNKEKIKCKFFSPGSDSLESLHGSTGLEYSEPTVLRDSIERQALTVYSMICRV